MKLCNLRIQLHISRTDDSLSTIAKIGIFLKNTKSISIFSLQLNYNVQKLLTIYSLFLISSLIFMFYKHHTDNYFLALLILTLNPYM